jgi:hypothetical protein
VIVVCMVWCVSFGPRLPLLTRRAPAYPNGDRDDESSGRHLEVRLGGLAVELACVMQAGQRDDPNDKGVGHGCGKPQQHRLCDRAAHRDDEGGHHRLAVARLQPMQCAKENRRWNEQPGVRCALLEKTGKRCHAWVKGIS